MSNNQSTGLKRDVLDKFYTNKVIVEECVSMFKQARNKQRCDANPDYELLYQLDAAITDEIAGLPTTAEDHYIRLAVNSHEVQAGWCQRLFQRQGNQSSRDSERAALMAGQ